MCNNRKHNLNTVYLPGVQITGPVPPKNMYNSKISINKNSVMIFCDNDVNSWAVGERAQKTKLLLSCIYEIAGL